MSLENTKKWFEQAIPNPTIDDACVQVGCAYEETAELSNTIGDNEAELTLSVSSGFYKNKNQYALDDLKNADRVQMLDDIIDEIVTRVGIGHCMGFDVIGALDEVNRSNFSKFENGNPVFDENGKITKGKDYIKPNLEPYV